MNPTTSRGLPQTLLVCADGSPFCQGAINAALELSSLAEGRVFLVEVKARGREGAAQSLPMLPPDVNAQSLEYQLRFGSPVHEEILAVAAAVHADWIVMGRRGVTGLSRLLMGSVTARVIGYSPVNVLVVPRDAALKLKRIMIASDGSQYSDAAWEEALALTKMAGANLVAVTAARDEKRAMDGRLLLQHLEAAATRTGVLLETHLIKGWPFEAVLSAAKEHRADLIILGSHGRTGLKRLLMGSVAERVIGQAKCPVLLVKRKD
jgi:nucleotide-binding universal stress UspA family protein